MQAFTDLQAALGKPENFIAAVAAAAAIVSAVWAGIAILQTRAARRLALADAKARTAVVDGYLNDTYLQELDGKLRAVFECTYVNKGTDPNSIVRVDLAVHQLSKKQSHLLLSPSKGSAPAPLALICPAYIGARATLSGVLRFDLPEGLQVGGVKRYDLRAHLADGNVCTLSAHLMRKRDE